MTKDKQPMLLSEYRKKTPLRVEFPYRVTRHPACTEFLKPTKVRVSPEFVADGWRIWRNIKKDPFRRQKFANYFWVIKGRGRAED